jgi:cytochrome c peroxidase
VTDSGAPMSSPQILLALAAFESSLISLDSRYDHYAHGADDALRPQEIAGLNVFRSFVTRCVQCHVPPLFTDGQLAVVGAPDGEQRPFDPGAGALNTDPALRGAFKVPGLRNLACTAPYMHSGVFESLEQVIAFYNKGPGNSAPASENLQIHWHIVAPHLSAREQSDLRAFLLTLTDTANT